MNNTAYGSDGEEANWALVSDPSGWLYSTFRRLGGVYPTIEQLWGLMDETWDALGCTTQQSECIGVFYAHPVWLLNGLFIEQHAQSLAHRREFANWVAGRSPRRIADFGGGFGTLARLIGEQCPRAEIEIIEPYPHPVATSRVQANICYRPKLTGEYDTLIAIDVFEHVKDPLALVERTACHLRANGHYLIANCFWPVIKCHLPQTFHFRHSWDAALAAIGLMPAEPVCYGRAFVRRGLLDLSKARVVERRSMRLFPWLEAMPPPLRYRVANLMFATVRSASSS